MKNTSKNIMATFVLSSLSLQAVAMDYKPFATVDPSVEQRSDLKGKLKKLRVALPAGGETAFTLVQLSDVRLSLFTEIAGFLTTSTRPGPMVSIDVKSPAPECTTYEAVAREPLPPVKTDASCAAISQAVAQAFMTGFEKACRYVHQPLRYVEDQPPGDMVHENMKNLEGLISLAGEAMLHFQFPDNFISCAKLQQLSDIVAKIRTPKLTAALDTNLTRLSQAKSALQAKASCAVSPTELNKTLDLLIQETRTASSRLAELDQTGRAQAAVDAQKVTAAGRAREVLPFPSLSDDDRQTLSMIVGGVYWRMRGGGLVDDPKGTQETRLVFHKYPSEVIGELNGGKIGRAAGGEFYPRVFQGWGQWMDMGRTPGEKDRFYDLTFMTDRGLYHVEGAASVLSRAGYDTSSLIAGGLHMGAVYYFSWDQLTKSSVGPAPQPLPYQGFLGYPTEWGEVAIGGAMNLGLSKTLLKGAAKPR